MGSFVDFDESCDPEVFHGFLLRIGFLKNFLKTFYLDVQIIEVR